MTADVVTSELPPRLLLLNSADRARMRSVAAFMQAHWPAVSFDAEELALLVQRGLPGQYPGDGDPGRSLVACRHAAIQVGSTLAHLFEPLVVVPATLTRRYDVAELAQGLGARRVQFAHVVVTVTDHELPDEHAVRAARELDVMPADARFDATGLDAGAISAGLVGVLVQLGWLRRDRQWTGEDFQEPPVVENVWSDPSTSTGRRRDG
jgi:hypothetical protein